jgi:hypothetical protein
MDDLTVLREVRAAEPGPSAAETTAARNALLTAIASAAQPPSGRRASGPRATARRAPRRRIWIPVAAAAAALAAGAGVLTLAPGGSQHAASGPGVSSPGSASHPAGPVAPVYRPTTLTAAVVLDKAAAAAAREDRTTGKYFFTETEGISTVTGGSDPAAYRVGPELRQSWFGNGVDGRVVEPQPLAGLVGPALGGGGLRTINTGTSSSVGMTWAQLRSLPTAPGPLLAIVARNAVPFPKSPNSAASGEFEFIQELLLGNPIPPAVQAALYRVAAGLPGIKAVDTTDLVGRPAIEVYVEPGPNAPAVGQALYVSPVTFQLLGEARLGDAANLNCPVGWSAAILATGYVSSDTQLPAGTPTKLERAYYSNSVPGCPGTVLTSVPPWAKRFEAGLRRFEEQRAQHQRHA